MKKLITLITLLALPALAGDKPTKSPTFAAGEFSVHSSYTARFSGSFDKPEQGVKFGGDYALNRNLLVGAYGVSYNDVNNTVNEVVGRVTLRAPLKFTGETISVYGFGEGGGNIQTGEGFAGAGGGVEVRPFGKLIGLFAESDLRLNTDWQSSIGISGGLRLSF